MGDEAELSAMVERMENLRSGDVPIDPKVGLRCALKEAVRAAISFRARCNQAERSAARAEARLNDVARWVDDVNSWLRTVKAERDAEASEHQAYAQTLQDEARTVERRAQEAEARAFDAERRAARAEAELAHRARSVRRSRVFHSSSECAKCDTTDCETERSAECTDSISQSKSLQAVGVHDLVKRLSVLETRAAELGKPEGSRVHIRALSMLRENIKSSHCRWERQLDRISNRLSALHEEAHKCVIDLEPLRPGDRVVRLPCMHVFHEQCLMPYIRSGDVTRCPIDRAEIPPDSIDSLPVWTLAESDTNVTASGNSPVSSAKSICSDELEEQTSPPCTPLSGTSTGTNFNSDSDWSFTPIL